MFTLCHLYLYKQVKSVDKQKGNHFIAVAFQAFLAFSDMHLPFQHYLTELPIGPIDEHSYQAQKKRRRWFQKIYL